MVAATVGLRGLSLCTLSLPILRSAKIKLPIHSFPTSRSLKPLFSPYNPTILRGFPSFCASPDVNVEATATAPPATEAENSQSADDIKNAANLLDIRVGRIIKAWRHEEAYSLYVEEVDVGEPEPRIICSGLVKYMPLDLLQDAKVVVLANLKPRNMRGVKTVELLIPPDGTIPGERIWFGTEDDKDSQPEPATPNQVQKKKIWESVQPHLKTDASCTAMLGEYLMRTLQV
ncbi:hypothetical protein E1A91_1Z013600v1 [Gossypium mustelinum]|uniref:tRNA-binding domain-containing protein n=1 Tax=Gossypium mustelinum TaxID=34275 RepID=A0A5C7J1Q5_GOSMU|nr:hypothetical protein E1A91_1Z013600v1 [Gossypium mustelinum]